MPSARDGSASTIVLPDERHADGEQGHDGRGHCRQAQLGAWLVHGSIVPHRSSGYLRSGGRGGYRKHRARLTTRQSRFEIGRNPVEIVRGNASGDDDVGVAVGGPDALDVSQHRQLLAGAGADPVSRYSDTSRSPDPIQQVSVITQARTDSVVPPSTSCRHRDSTAGLNRPSIVLGELMFEACRVGGFGGSQAPRRSSAHDRSPAARQTARSIAAGRTPAP